MRTFPTLTAILGIAILAGCKPASREVEKRLAEYQVRLQACVDSMDNKSRIPIMGGCENDMANSSQLIQGNGSVSILGHVHRLKIWTGTDSNEVEARFHSVASALITGIAMYASRQSSKAVLGNETTNGECNLCVA